MKSKNAIKFGIWVVLVSASVIFLFLFPSLSIYIGGVLAVLIVYGIAQFQALLGVRRELSVDQSINTSLQCTVLIVLLLFLQNLL